MLKDDGRGVPWGAVAPHHFTAGKRSTRGGPRIARAHALAGALLTFTLTTALGACGSVSSGGASSTPNVTATQTAAPTLTPAPADPTGYGWVRVSAARWGSVSFAATNPLRGYLCGIDDTVGGAGRVFGVTTDGGQTWQFKQSPASYPTCSVHISPTDPLRVTIDSVNAPGDGQSAFVDAHYSSDGGQTWAAAPIPPNTLEPGEALWVGTYLYMMIGANKGQAPSLQVSANGGPFTALDVPDVPSPYIVSALVVGDKLYLNLLGNCSQGCPSIVSTADGGKTWARIPNQSKLVLSAVIGNTLYANVFDSHNSSVLVMSSTDGGANWSAVTLPALPDGSSASNYSVAPDGTIFVATPQRLYSLHGQTWTELMFSARASDSPGITAFSVDATGRPTRVWVDDEGTHQGQYAHTL